MEKNIRLFDIIKLLIIAVLVLFISTPIANANEVTRTEEGTVLIKADSKHIKILNELRGTEISLGKLIEKVFPEAIEDMPKKTLYNMYNTPYPWDSNSSGESLTWDTKLAEESLNSGGGTVNITSYLGSSLHPLKFHSSTTIVPWGAHTFDYLSVLSLQEYRPFNSSSITINESAYEYGDNTLRIKASGEWDGFKLGGFRTRGTHYLEDAETLPPVVVQESCTNWMWVVN